MEIKPSKGAEHIKISYDGFPIYRYCVQSSILERPATNSGSLLKIY